MSFKSEFSKGIINENPTFRMLLGMCPTLATSLAISNGIGMGLAQKALSALRQYL
jgi:electron transport complex protein RnfE